MPRGGQGAERGAWHDGADGSARRTTLPGARQQGRMAGVGTGEVGVETKVFALTNFKALSAPEGVFEALVAVFGNVDRVGDTIVKGAFGESLAAWEAKARPIPIIFSHEWENLDAHIGTVLQAKELDEGLYVKGQLEMDEPFAARVWKKLEQGVLAEFSFAYDIPEGGSALVDRGAKEVPRYVNELRQLELLEVGPCLVGMNPETQLISVKAALASHSTGTSDDAWDGPANEARVRSDETVAYYRRIYAWQDPEGDASVKATYRFIHHQVAEGGAPGAANIRACQTGIGVLNGGRGGTTIPDGDRQGVYNHLARHLRDADLEPPELKAAGTGLLEAIYRLIDRHDLDAAIGEDAHEDDAGGDAGKSSMPASALALRIAVELLEKGSETD